jgi:phage tail-like protein
MARDPDSYPDPFVHNSFGISLVDNSGLEIAMFTSISGGAGEIKVIKYTLNNMPGRRGLRIVGPAGIEPVTLSFGVTTNTFFWDWWTSAKSGLPNRQDVTIKAFGARPTLDEDKVFAEWTLTNAWPQSISGFNFDLDSNEAYIAEVTLIHEGITRVQ